MTNSCEHLPKYGRSSLCKKCYKANWYLAHRTEINTRRRNEYAVNPACKKQAIEAVTAWQKSNPQKVANRGKRYYTRHHKEVRTRARARNERNNQTRKRWRHQNVEHVRLQGRIDRQKRRARVNGNVDSFTAKEWKTLKRQYGHRCVGCWKTEKELSVLGRKLVPDHIIPVAKGGLNHITNLQPLCHGRSGCNNKKGAKYIDFVIS